MNKLIDLNNFYVTSKKSFDTLFYNNSKLNEKDILTLINKLTLEKNFISLEKEENDLDDISNLLRYYENMLNSFYRSNLDEFESAFRCYILLIKSFINLCKLLSKNNTKKQQINFIIELLIESENILKFTIALKEKDILILNDLIGKELYYFTHVSYIIKENKSIDYILDKYLLECEKIVHGYDLSASCDFINTKNSYKEIEYSIFVNNFSFLLLKMTHSLKYYFDKINYFDKESFEKILELFKNKLNLEKKYIINHIKEFENSLIMEFIEHGKLIKKISKKDVFKEKIDLLSFNTDEYKELIDIIISLK